MTFYDITTTINNGAWHRVSPILLSFPHDIVGVRGILANIVSSIRKFYNFQD